MKHTLMAACVASALAASPAFSQDIQSVAFFVNGTLGDKSFFDSAQRGMDRLGGELGLETRTIEAGFDPTRWESALVDLADSGEYDTIITGTFTMVSYVEQLSQEFPEVNFILFDGIVNYAECGCENVHSILFKQNEGSYLAGVLAATLTTETTDSLNPDPVLGFVGGMEIPVIQDFFVGYKAGAESVLTGPTMLEQYANNFGDPAIGKEIALAQYGQGADIVFAVAGGTGQGVLEAAVEQGRLAFGVDSDQAAIFAESNPEIANRIVTSVLKNVDNALVSAVTRIQAGENLFGTAEAQGLETGGVGLAINDVTRAYVSAETLSRLDEIAAQIIDGSIEVPTAF
ncbi:BMP family ABC transporter substrate-binding protein [Yoonia litorea]|uniref:Nucleoside-binding protein n=1 Tax=Yoonia litorea TaxID=1123755 RepID=A0A1I6MDX2_9RHOB|nr:BMP family ABC transporter substrate-binding protein [Yoonia litorea]SFS13919.1 nucleoside-binding protein [Yoonia litorea]